MAEHVVAIVQARMGSSRLPGKVLLDLAGQPVLGHVVRRLRRAQRVDLIGVATTTDRSDDPLAEFCLDLGLPCWRGSTFDVLERFVQAGRAAQADVVVRITADCPLIDPEVVNAVVTALLDTPGCDFACNRLPPPWKRTFPIGLDVETCRMAALERAAREATQTYQREHVMPYLYDTPGRFGVLQLHTSPDYGNLRWTLDTPADLQALRQLFAAFADRDHFSWHQALEWWLAHPEVSALNATVQHKSLTDVDVRWEQKP
jgi:spore coat polysaccharide biosynthesis protein SpsF